MRESRQQHQAANNNYDQFLKRLETVKHKPQQPTRTTSPDNYSHTDSTFDSIRYTQDDSNSKDEEELMKIAAQFDDIQVIEEQRNANNSTANDHNASAYQTRQSFVDRQHPETQLSEAVDSFIQLSNSRSNLQFTGPETEDNLPDAILKLDRRHDIPSPRHKNDVLLEIEASTVDRRDLMIRPGVRCTQSLPQGVETVGMDCIGRVVQLTTHARAIYGISIDDRVAAIYPFEYKDGYKEESKGLQKTSKRYALVDGGFVVTVPKNVDAADAACMVRLYLSAFQSISKGITNLHDRYGINQLQGQSILIQNGQTDLGRVLIELAKLLGATQIFATGPTEVHPMLLEMGAIPLGVDTFNWELFLEEKISLVLVQESPTADNFEQFLSVLDETKGNMVYIHHGHKDDMDDLTLVEMADNGCLDGCAFDELTNKAKAAVNSAKFSLRLTCSPNYIVYEGVWPSCKENPNQFKEDLRYLFTLLGQGRLKPNVDECINLEEVSEVQDRIELLGKKGTIVCLPTALYEKKAYHVSSPPNSPRRGETGYPGVVNDIVYNGNEDDHKDSYASDAGYVTKAPSDILSGFHSMRTRTHTRKPSSLTSDNSDLLPALPEASPYTQRADTLNRPTINDFMQDTSISVANHNDAASLISSVGQNSAADYNTTQSEGGAMSRQKTEEESIDLPMSIQFGSKKRSIRYRAYQRQKEAKKQSQKSGDEEVDDDKSVMSMASTKSASSKYTRRRLREKAREQRQKQKTGAVSEDSNDKPVASEIVIKTKVKGLRKTTEKSWQRNVEGGSKPQFNRNSLRKVQLAPRLANSPGSDARDECGSKEGSETRDNSTETSFNSIMNKWKNIEEMSIE